MFKKLDENNSGEAQSEHIYRANSDNMQLGVFRNSGMVLDFPEISKWVILPLHV